MGGQWIGFVDRNQSKGVLFVFCRRISSLASADFIRAVAQLSRRIARKRRARSQMANLKFQKLV
jgi:hypothetical protein